MSAGQAAAGGSPAAESREPVSLRTAFRATIADLLADGYDPRDIAMAMFGTQGERESWFGRRGLADPLQEREAGE